MTNVSEKINANNLDWTKILAFESYNFHKIEYYRNFAKLNKINFRSYLSHIKSLMLSVFKYSPSLQKKGSKKNQLMLFFKSMKRPDYDLIFDKVYDLCSYESKIKINLSIISTKHFYWKNVILFTKNLPVLLPFINKNFFFNFYLFCWYIQYLIILKEIKIYNPAFVVVFSDMQPADNMIAQFYNHKTIPTITLQHGLYINYNKLDNINRINYSNVVSKYFLAWGNETKELIQKFAPNTNVIICGKPIKQIELLNNTQSNYFTVVFDQELFKEYNKKLLEIAITISRKLSLDLNIRFHPANKPEDYNFENKNYKTNLDIYGSRFCIGHTSSMIYESLRQGLVCYKLVSAIPGNKTPHNLLFYTAEDLLQKINLPQNPVKEGKYYIEFIDNESVHEYSKFFNTLTL